MFPVFRLPGNREGATNHAIKTIPANFVGQKRTKTANRPQSTPQKGETGCVLGAGGGSSDWRRMKLGEKESYRGCGSFLLSAGQAEHLAVQPGTKCGAKPRDPIV